jgi:hypothetical protein
LSQKRKIIDIDTSNWQKMMERSGWRNKIEKNEKGTLKAERGREPQRKST